MSHIERNPIREKRGRVAWRYPWSSAAAHCGDEDRSTLLDLATWFKQWRGDRWKTELRHREDAAEVSQIHRCLRTGRPLASDRFISKVEVVLGKRLRPKPVGRPRKKKAAERSQCEKSGK